MAKTSLKRKQRPGPKLPGNIDAVRKRTVSLDDDTVALAKVLGVSLSDGLRNAVRTAYAAYQASPD